MYANASLLATTPNVLVSTTREKSERGLSPEQVTRGNGESATADQHSYGEEYLSLMIGPRVCGFPVRQQPG